MLPKCCRHSQLSSWVQIMALHTGTPLMLAQIMEILGHNIQFSQNPKSFASRRTDIGLLSPELSPAALKECSRGGVLYLQVWKQ